ncbi:MAG TPA: ABC transporter permease [Cyclobacteriaceae bacterium]|nr:ABC transporter permease [Cyclobacteriaceae bacterium]
MLKNSLLLFLRNLRRQRLFSIVNLLGLCVSLTSTLLIYIYVRHEYSFDNFHKDIDRIYRVNQTYIWGENSAAQFARTGPGVAFSVKEEIPEIEIMTSVHTPGNFVISYTTPSKQVIALEQQLIFAADTNFFKMFDFEFVYGHPGGALQTANTLVFRKEIAEAYFGKTDPVGLLVLVGEGTERKTFEVTGVVDVPENSSINFNVLFSMKNYPIERFSWSWVWTQLETYVKLVPGANLQEVTEKLSKVPEKHVGLSLQRAFNTTWDEFRKSGKNWELFLQPMTQLHLPSTVIYGNSMDSANKTVLLSLIGVSVFIVLLSCVNFTNLSIAQFTRRVKDTSLRKILGMGKRELTITALFEAIAFCLVSLLLALAATQALLPGFSLLTGRGLRLDLLSDPNMIPGGIALALVMAMVSSIYPVIYLNSFNPVDGIKSKTQRGPLKSFFQNGIVVFQFSVSIVLIICTAIVFQQLRFASTKDVGFDKENLALVQYVELTSAGESLVDQMKSVPGVIDASWCASAPPQIWDGDSFTAEGSDKTLTLSFTRGDENYIPTLGIKLKFGRNFLKENPADINGVILNETAAQRIGWDLNESVIGKRVYYGDAAFEVLGIMTDFNFWSSLNQVEPLAIFHMKDTVIYQPSKKFVVVRLAPGDPSAIESTLASIGAVWKKNVSDAPFAYTFVDETFARAFLTQQRFGNVLTVMAGLAIMIASLGLLGMIIYALERRTKEIGIRKVNGASLSDILLLISGSYVKLITLAFVIAAPLAWFMMDKWLQDFSERITPSSWIFVAAGSGVLLLAALITGYHSLKASMMNPVSVLRDE